jgi:peptidoglycan/LPS O-acetylase OafA/YrhL
MTANHDIRALTSIRGIAAWWIVLFHFREYVPALSNPSFDLIGHGYLAVDLFFELSGFVIALNYGRLFRNFSTAEWFRFLGRRLARIYPLHLLMLFIFLLNPLVIGYLASRPLFERYDPGYFVLSVFLVQNWGFTHLLAWNVPAWSISTEWMAYLLFPAICWITIRFARSRGHALLLAALLMVALAAGFAAFHELLGGAVPRTGLFRCVMEFWLGVCLYYTWSGGGPRKEYESHIALTLAVLCGILYATLDLPDFTIVPLGFFCLIYALADQRTVFSKMVSNRALEFVGLISYSTYMVHYFVRDWIKIILIQDGVPVAVQALAYIAITAGVSVLLYRYVEVPGRSFLRGVMNTSVSLEPEAVQRRQFP